MRRDGAQWAWKPVPPRVALGVLGVLAAVCLSACDSSPTEPPPVANTVDWIRITNPATIIEPDHPNWLADSITFDYVDGTGYNHIGTISDDGSGAVLYPDVVPYRDFGPVWVKDGLIIYASDKAGPPPESYDLWYRDVPAGTTRRLTSFLEHEWDPAPRPGLPSLVYTQGDDMLRGRITLIPDTSAATLTRVYLTASSLAAGEPGWDSAGNRLCISVEDPDGTRHIWVIELSGSTVISSTRITTGPFHDRHPRFSPDGTKILFVSDRTGRSGVWWVSPAGDANGLEVISFEDPGAEIRSPSWSPDGKRIVLSSDGRGGRALWILSDLGF